MGYHFIREKSLWMCESIPLPSSLHQENGGEYESKSGVWITVEDFLSIIYLQKDWRSSLSDILMHSFRTCITCHAHTYCYFSIQNPRMFLHAVHKTSDLHCGNKKCSKNSHCIYYKNYKLGYYRNQLSYLQCLWIPQGTTYNEKSILICFPFSKRQKLWIATPVENESNGKILSSRET